jgi:hypothetical protein
MPAEGRRGGLHFPGAEQARLLPVAGRRASRSHEGPPCQSRATTVAGHGRAPVAGRTLPLLRLAYGLWCGSRGLPRGSHVPAPLRVGCPPWRTSRVRDGVAPPARPPGCATASLPSRSTRSRQWSRGGTRHMRASSTPPRSLRMRARSAGATWRPGAEARSTAAPNSTRSPCLRSGPPRSHPGAGRARWSTPSTRPTRRCSPRSCGRRPPRPSSVSSASGTVTGGSGGRAV